MDPTTRTTAGERETGAHLTPPEDVARLQIAELSRRWGEEMAERDHAERMQRAYDGRWGADVPPMPGEDSSHQQAKRVVALGLVRYLVEEASGLYDTEPTRTLIRDTPEERAWWERAVWGFGGGMSSVLDRLDAMTRLHGTALAWWRYRASERAAADLQATLTGISAEVHPDARRLLEDAPTHEGDDGQVRAVDGVEGIVVPRQRFVLLPNATDPHHVEAVAIHLGDAPRATDTVQTSTPSSSLVSRDDLHLYMDRRYIALLRGWSTVPLDETGATLVEHGFGDLPIVVGRQTEGDFSAHGQPWGGVDLWETLLHVGRLMTEYGWTAVLQRGQPWTTLPEGRPLVLGPDCMLYLGAPDEKVGIASNAANLGGIREAIMTLLHLLTRTLSLPSRTLQIESSAMSGVAIAMDRETLAEERRRRRKTTARWERQSHEIAALLYARSTGTRPRSGLASVRYADPRTLATFAEMLDQLRLEREEGVLSRDGLLRRLRPEMTTQERAEEIRLARLERLEDAAFMARQEAGATREAEPAPVDHDGNGAEAPVETGERHDAADEDGAGA